jgi:hypothetical protein
LGETTDEEGLCGERPTLVGEVAGVGEQLSKRRGVEADRSLEKNGEEGEDNVVENTNRNASLSCIQNRKLTNASEMRKRFLAVQNRKKVLHTQQNSALSFSISCTAVHI